MGEDKITQDYNQKNRARLWDSNSAKKDFKNKTFGDKETYFDPISGKTLHKSQTAAQRKYHMKDKEGKNNSTKWAGYASEVDHIVALKDVHDRAKHYPNLTDKDVREIANMEQNFRILSKSYNTSKGAKSDFETILDFKNDLTPQARMELTKGKVKAEVAVQTQLTAHSVKNTSDKFADGAKDTLINSAIPLTAEAVRKMIEVAQGEKSLSEAAGEMGKTTLEVAVAGGANRLLIDTVTKQLLTSSNPMIQSIVRSNQVSQLIATAMIVKDSAMRYINGEIDGEGFIEEVGEKGMSLAAGMIGGTIGKEIGMFIGGVAGTLAIPGIGTVGGAAVGGAVGSFVGAILGTMVVTLACNGIVSAYHAVKSLDDYKVSERRMRRLEAEAIKEIGRQRDIFKDVVTKEFQVWDKHIMEGFDEMLSCACEATFNLDGVTDGLEKILAVFGKKVRFKTIEEYENQLSQPLTFRF